MAGTKEIKRRIKSVKNTKKITKAMELVSAAKMKRVVVKTLASRLYANYSWDLLTSLSYSLKEISHPFFESTRSSNFLKNKNINNVLILVITSNRGLCGGYNSQILKNTILNLKSFDQNENIDFVVVGKKGDGMLRRTGQNIIASFSELPDVITLNDISPVSKLLITEFKEKKYKKVYVAYTDYISALNQKPKFRQLLPISKKDLKEMIDETANSKLNPDENKIKEVKKVQYIFEGEMNTLLESLSEKLVKMQIYQMLLESNASEQSSRMVAMKNAGDAAGEMIDDLTLVFNKARQANITKEISEISAGMASLS